MKNSPKHSRRRWKSHAIGAGGLALLAFLGSAAPEFLGDDFKQKFAPYNKWVLAVLGVAVVVEIVRAIVTARANDDHPEVSGKDSEPKQTGLSIGDHNQGAFSFRGGAVTATNTQGDVVGRDKITHVYNAPSSEPNRKHQLPSPPPDFTGREGELNELLAKLGQGVTISGIRGLGGVGKTALALKLAERVKDRFPDAQIYMDLQGAGANPLTPARAMEYVIRAYHPMAKLPESFSELSALYRSTLHSQRALLLMDNARDREQVEPLIPPAGCALMVTSRRHFTLPGMFDQNLDTLPRADAIKLLLNIADRIGDHADEIARLCGDLPLALRVAASALAERHNLTPADYARRLADANQRLSHLKEVDVAFNLSYEMLSEDQRRLWRALSVFPQTFDDEAAAAVWEMERDASQDALGDLIKWSLVEFSVETKRHRLHDLARLFAGAKLSEVGVEEPDAAQRRFALYYQTVIASCNSLYLEGNESMLRGLMLFDQEWDNIQAGQSWAEAKMEKDRIAAHLCIDYPNIGVYILSLRLDIREFIHWLEVQLAAARQLKMRDHEGAALGNLGNAWHIRGDPRKAIGFHEQYLPIAREIGDRSGEGTALGNLGLAWAGLGETRKAIEFYKEHLSIAREIGDRRAEGQALGNLGAAHRNLGEARKAIELLEQRIVIARDIGDRRGEGAALGNLGLAWADLGETGNAMEFYEQYLIIAREIGDRNGEGNALFNMSLSADKLADRTQAMTLAEAALKIFEAIESPYAEGARRQLVEWRRQAK